MTQDPNLTVEQAVQLMNRKERRSVGMQKPTVKHCHEQVKATAIGLATCLFEELMRNNKIYSQFKAQHEGLTTKQMEAKFVARLWPQMLPQARATMAAMLNGPYSEEMKEEIMDVLVKDQSLVRGRKNPAVLMGAVK